MDLPMPSHPQRIRSRRHPTPISRCSCDGLLVYTVSVPIVFDREIHVHYGQFYVHSGSGWPADPLTESLGGQANGLCGAAVPGQLFLITGLHTGSTRVTVEVLDALPPIGDEWEDVVEASFRPASAQVALVEWAGQAAWPLPLVPIDYLRVRYSATGMDQARQKDTLRAGEPLVDRYLLQLWPAPPAPDAVIRATSRCAADWLARARTLPSPPTREQPAEAKRQERAAKVRARFDAAPAAQSHLWGGPLPDERVRGERVARRLAKLDRKLLDGIAELDPATQRAVAIWAARRACAVAGLTDLDWVKPAFAAFERGESLPFDLGAASGLLRADPHVRLTTVTSPDGGSQNVPQQDMALNTLRSAAAEDPLSAALESLWYAIVTFGVDYRRLLSEVREAFPKLAET